MIVKSIMIITTIALIIAFITTQPNVSTLIELVRGWYIGYKALAFKLSHHVIGFLAKVSFHSTKSDQTYAISAAKSAKALYFDSVLDLETNFLLP